LSRDLKDKVIDTPERPSVFPSYAAGAVGATLIWEAGIWPSNETDGSTGPGAILVDWCVLGSGAMAIGLVGGA